jgi:hypothetical protein
MRERYTVHLLGELWWPMGAEAATDRTIYADTDAEALAMAEFEAGDFSHLIDFSVTTGACRHDFRVVREWDSEDSELRYWDCMDPEPWQEEFVS